MAAVTKAVVDFCNRHCNVITTPQLRQCGANSRQVTALARNGVISRVHPGVYALAGGTRHHALAARVAMAALQTNHPGRMFVASHLSAAWLQGLVEKAPPLVHVTTTTPHRRYLRGTRVHHTGPPLERRPYQGIPCTLPARTLVDLAATATPHQLADAVDRALSKGIVRMRDLEDEIHKGGRRGTAQLRRCLQERGLIGAPSPSVLESRMARLITRFGLPLPKGEVIAGAHGEYRIDYANPERRLAVELYGYVHHSSPEQMTYDHARQRQLTIQGWTVLVYTWSDVTRRPEQVAGEIREATRGEIPKS